MFGNLIRILLGATAAYLAAAATKIMFTYPPNVLQSLTPEQTSEVFNLIPRSAAHMAIFSLPLALLVMAIGERRRWRDWAYYAAAAIILALIGYFSIYTYQDARQGWSITSSNYPLIAFLTTGFVGGVVYWLIAGRLAGGPHAPVPNGQHMHPAQRAVAAANNGRR